MTVPKIAYIDRSDRVRLEIFGPERARFLHNLTTNEVKHLPVGKGCEAFVTSPQGKTLGAVTLHAREDRILLRADPGAQAGLLPHLLNYGIFDRVEVRDVSAQTYEFHLIGRLLSERLLSGAGLQPPAPDDLCHVVSTLARRSVLVIGESPTGRPGRTMIGPLDDSRRIGDFLNLFANREVLDPHIFNALRIEAGTPVFGRDVTPDNLPQEVGRDARAINFVKGCYLGQETVARIDALGHVNKVLKGLKLAGLAVPPPGTALEWDGKTVGAITSSAFSAGWDTPIALGYVRVQHAQPGTVLRAVFAKGPAAAVVADLPMLPPEGQTPSSG